MSASRTSLNPLVLLASPLVFLGLLDGFRLPGRRLALLAAALMLLNLKGWYVWHTMHENAVAHLHKVHGKTAAFLSRRTVPGEAVAAFDIGRLQWDTDASIVDISGLANPEVVPYVAAADVPSYLVESDIDLLAMIHTYRGATPFPFHRELGFSGGMPKFRTLFSSAVRKPRYVLHADALYNAYPIVAVYARKVSPGNDHEVEN